MENETLKVQHGALVAMMATRHRNMYIPKTSTVVGGVVIGKVISNIIRHLELANNNILFESVKNCKFEVCEPCSLGSPLKILPCSYLTLKIHFYP